MKMRLKKLGLVAVAAGAFGVILASSALGAIKTEEAEWYTGSTVPTTVTVSQDTKVNLKAGGHNSQDGITSTNYISGYPGRN